MSQQGATAFTPVAPVNNTSAFSSLPSYGGLQNLGSPGGSNLFGGQSNPPGFFGQSNVSAPTTDYFGTQQQPSSFFGAPLTQNMGSQPQNNSFFNANNNTSLFQPNAFNNPQPQQNSLFGSSPGFSNLISAPTGSLFNQQQNQGSFFS